MTEEEVYKFERQQARRFFIRSCVKGFLLGSMIGGLIMIFLGVAFLDTVFFGLGLLCFVLAKVAYPDWKRP
jgi:predicted lipid-binding transport protein (Tim44 family)